MRGLRGGGCLFIFRDLLGTFFGFKIHIVDKDLKNLAVLQHIVQYLVRRIGMYVHLVVGVCAH